jgi:Leucine-rich repeat (LRR) protein
MGLQALPIDLGRFPSLEHLDLSGNRLTSLPDSLARLKHLKGLNLANNPKMNWPKALLLITECPALQRLSLADNNLTVIPGEMLHISRLRVLHLDQNPMNPFAARNAMNLPESLRHLSVMACQLAEVSPQIRSLHRLHTITTDTDNDHALEVLHHMLPQLRVAMA